MADQADLVQQFHYFILIDNSGCKRVVQADKKKIVHFKKWIDLNQIIGKPYGAFYSVEDYESGNI